MAERDHQFREWYADLDQRNQGDSSVQGTLRKFLRSKAMKRTAIAIALILTGLLMGTGLKPVGAQTWSFGPMVATPAACGPYPGIPSFCSVGSGTTGVFYVNFGGGWNPLASQGPPGPPGAAATVTIGTTTTGAPGSSASVTNVGTSTAAVLNFVVPQGLQGAQGNTGVMPANCPNPQLVVPGGLTFGPNCK